MSAVSHIRPQPIARFDAWRISGQHSHATAVSQASLADAVADACRLCVHKDRFVVRENNGEVATLRFYGVKQKSTARYAIVDHVMTRMHDLYAEELLSMQVSVFAPIEPWQWAPGADVVGHRPMVIA